MPPTLSIPPHEAETIRDEETPRSGADSRREDLRHWIELQPTGLAEDEVAAHFETMPRRYWGRVRQSELVWGLRAVHNFLHRVTNSSGNVTVPIVGWQHFPEEGFTKVLVCTWDDLGLLVKVAACFRAVRLNVTRADIFTRSDNIALDVFWITNPQGASVANEKPLEQMMFLLEGALAEVPRFASVWACVGHKFMQQPKGFAPLVYLDNHASPDETLVEVIVGDRIGLLHDLVLGLSECGVNITEAFIDTSGGLARDQFFVTEHGGGKLTEAARIPEVRRHLLEMLK